MADSLIVKLVLEAQQFHAALQEARGEIQGMASAAVEGGSRSDSAMQRLGKSLSNIGDAVTKAGERMTLFATGPILAFGAAATKSAGDLQSMENTFQAVTGATEAQMRQMDALAVALGNDMTLPGTSALDAAEAMLELAKAGLSIDQTFRAAKGTLQLAAAAQVDAATAATITANALNAFGLSGDQAVHVADLLAASANASSGEITDMAEALQATGAVAHMTGQSIEDTVTAISLMANAGIQGSDAGTSLKQMLLSLINPSEKAAEVMRRYGIVTTDAHGRMLPLPRLVEEFSQKLGKLPEAQRNAALATIFGSDAVRAANIVLMSGRDAWDQMAQAVNRAGAAQQVAASKMQGFNGALQAFQNAGETLLTSLGQRLLPVLTDLFLHLANLVNWLGSLPAPVQNAILAFAGFLAALGPTLIVTGTLAKNIGNLIELNDKLGGKLFALAARFVSIAGPIGLAAAAIGVAAYLIIQHWDTIGPFFQNLWNRVQQGVSAFWNWLKSFIATWGPAILAVLVPFIGVPLLVAQHWDQLRAFLVSMWTYLKTWVSNAANAVANAVVAAFRWMYNHNYYFQDLVDFIVRAWSTIRGVTTAVWSQVSSWLSSHWAYIRNLASSIFNGVWSAVTSIWSSIRSATISAWTSIRSAVSSAWASIRSTISGYASSIVAAARGPFDQIRAFISSIAHEAYAWGRNVVNSLASGIRSMASAVADAALDVARAIWRFLGFHSPTEAGPGAEADTWGPNLVRTVAEGIRANAPLVQSAVADLLTPVAATFSAPVGQMLFTAAPASMAALGPVNAAPVAVSGPRTVNIYVEVGGRELVRAIGVPLVEEIRLRTGARI